MSVAFSPPSARERQRWRGCISASACERVADGGQYRADIVAAIRRLRRERDETRANIGMLLPIARKLLERSAEANSADGKAYEDLKLKIVALGVDLAQAVMNFDSDAT